VALTVVDVSAPDAEHDPSASHDPAGAQPVTSIRLTQP
jgi:hypothetical protein